jgi:hypothetical protein
VFSQTTCVLTAFAMYLTGCTSVFLLCVISYERYLMINDPLNRRRFGLGKCFLLVAVCLLGGVFWASMPLLGWSHYSLEGAGTSCSVEWNERSWNVTSYNIGIFIFVFLIPVTYIFITNISLVIVVSSIKISFFFFINQKALI